MRGKVLPFEQELKTEVFFDARAAAGCEGKKDDRGWKIFFEMRVVGKGCVVSLSFVGSCEDETSEACGGWIVEHGADRGFVLKELGVVFGSGEIDDGMVGHECLNENFSWKIASASATSDLGDEGKGVLRGAKIGNGEG